MAAPNPLLKEGNTQREKTRTWFEIHMEKTWFQASVLVGGVLIYPLFGLALW